MSLPTPCPLRSALALRLLLAALLLLVAWPAAGGDAGNAQTAENADLEWHTDLDAALEEAKAKDAYLVVDLFAQWCGWCKRLDQEVFPAPAFRDFAEDKVLLRVDVEDGGEGTRLQARYGAYKLPTTLILDAGMVQVGKFQGFTQAPALVAHFEAELAAWSRIEERYPLILEAGSESLRRSLAQDLHERTDGERAARLYAKVLDGELSSLEKPWIYLQLADALRLAGEYDAAHEASAEARGLAQRQAAIGGALAEKLDLLDYQIAQDAGDCQEAKSTLENFLENHPNSKNRRVLAQRLLALQAGDSTICA